MEPRGVLGARGRGDVRAPAPAENRRRRDKFRGLVTGVDTEHPYRRQRHRDHAPRDCQLEADLHGLAECVLGGVEQRPLPPANRPNRALLRKPRR